MINKAYPVPKEKVRTEEHIKKSRFICDIMPVSTKGEAKEFISSIKSEFPDARHHCSAFIAGPPQTGDMGMSDDGEPQGTAGKPMLQVLQGSGIGDIAVVVTRYFGGILLGTGGLVRAYSGAVQQGLEALEVVMKVPMRRVTLEIGYAQEGMLRRMLPEFTAEIEEQTFGADITFSLIMPSDQVESFSRRIVEDTNGTAELLVEDEDVWK
ncbi:YigZ family protein [Maridesulfovibrio hydrothermalis]|uniref:IMPACT family member HI_0722 n=1 Tax=Maridesulfovibrio hydrothermalis AM13 = DSM 14728 TaxID=1121451 RepID=L0REC5_9BACT|nr:YigZ family protein [Maridesulfovibrio hydrothermalis]CCO23896.1 IMPACT family member HI_0722 [Maridesulfovibrio hydrothermalis AM13 = DSM 14728]